MRSRLAFTLALAGAGFLALDGGVLAGVVWWVYPFAESLLTAFAIGALIGGACGLVGGAILGLCVQAVNPPA